jgi:uncharacterized RDD family membrane protein YckC
MTPAPFAPPHGLRVEQTHAGFGRRVGAVLLDLVWRVPLAFLAGLVALVLFGSTETVAISGGGAWAWGIEGTSGAAGQVLVQAVQAGATLAFWHVRQATPGKAWLDMAIVDAATGGRVPFPRLVLRYLGYIVSGLPFGLGFLWVIWDRRRQGWHDKIAGTLVVRRRIRQEDIA